MPEPIGVHRRPRGLPAALVLLAAWSSWASAAEEPLGRLFFTPEHRAALDRQRQFAVQQQVPTVAEGASLSVDGVVVRSGGRSTVWINGSPQHEGSLPPELRTPPRHADPARVGISAAENVTRTLSVGQSISRNTGEVADPLAGGRIVVHREAAPTGKKTR